jgi:hypothetical protein
MSKSLSIEDRISILLTMIFDEGVDEYEQNFTKLLQRLNEFYDTNKVDIINYFTKVIMFIPTKGTIYANALHSFAKGDIINNIFKKLVEELNKNKNSFIYIRSFIFIFGLIHFGILQNDQLINFIKENITKKNKNLLQILVRSIFLLFRKNNQYQFLLQSINVIYESNIIDKTDIILNLLHTYANSDESYIINTKSKFDGFFIKDIPVNNSEKNNEDNNDINMKENIDNIFNELNSINYENIICPELITRKYLSKNNVTFLDIYYQLFLMNNIEAFKDEPNEGSKIYLFSLPNIYYNINTKEENNGINPYQFISDNFPFASMDLILYSLWNKSDLCYIVNFIVNVLSQKNIFFKSVNEENKEENIYTKFIIELISNVTMIQNLSHFQLDHLIFFLYHIISNISDTKIEILSQIQKLNLNLNNSNDTINNAITYFINSFYEKISFIIKKESLPSEIYFPEKKLTPNENESLYNSSFYNEISTNVKEKKHFNNFNKSLFEKDEQNEALYTFIYCLLNPNNVNNNDALSKIYENIELYGDGIRDIINNFEKKDNASLENDKMKIILKVIFDLYGNIPLYYIYIIDLFAFKNLLSHITIINFIFTEKLFQKKENGLFYGFYDLINNCVENCYNMLTKFDDDFQNLARSFSKVDENQRKEMQLKMEFYDNEVEKLKKQKDIICDKIMESFFKLYEISEKLGGKEYKSFIKNVIKDEFVLFQSRFKLNENWNEKIKNLDN